MSQSFIRISVSLQGTIKLPVICLVVFTQGTWVHGLAVWVNDRILQVFSYLNYSVILYINSMFQSYP